ncbi:MAG: alpha/beta fold hydrolase [Eubacteriales bacterium]|nr:alpha/beta fold hydrolase [Eubacteriales bacterium]
MSKTENDKPHSKSLFVRIMLFASVIILAFSVISITITKIVYDKQFPRYERHDETVSANLRYKDLEEDYPRQLFNFMSGKNKLQGYQYGAENDRGLVVVSHGIGGGADSYLPQITWFVDQGWRVLAYDSTGSFDSEGKTTRGFPQMLLDLDSLLTYVEETPGFSELPVMLFGHSWGGYAVSTVLYYEHDISGVVSVAGAEGPMDIVLEQGKSMMGSFIYIQFPYLWLYQHLLFGQAASLSASDAIISNDVPVMLIHGTEDEMVLFEGSSIIANMDKNLPDHVKLMICDQDKQNGHNSLFRSDEAIEYIDDINETYRALYDHHQQNIPYDIKQEFYETVDRELAQQLDESFMQEINSFYIESLP